MDCSPPGSSVCGILQARILEWVPFPTLGDLPDPGIEPTSPAPSALAGGFFATSTTWEAPQYTVTHVHQSALWSSIIFKCQGILLSKGREPLVYTLMARLYSVQSMKLQNTL